MGGRSADPRRHLGACERCAVERPHRRAVGWPAPTRRARGAVDRRLGSHRPRRADEPPRRRGDLVARRAHEAPLGEERRRPHRHHPRQVVPRRGLHENVGSARPDRRTVRGRIRRVRAAARGTGPDRGGDRVEAPEHDAQGARVAAPWRPGAHLEAEVSHRRRQRADRGRAARARSDQAAADVGCPARQGRRRSPRRRGLVRRSRDPEEDHVADRARRAHWDPRRERIWEVDAAEPDHRSPRPDIRARQARQDGAARAARSAVLAACRHRIRPRARGIGAREDDLQRRRQGSLPRTTARAARLRARASLGARR